jgi:hypothetical protein
MAADKAGLEGIMHSWPAWAINTFALFGVVWYLLDVLGVTSTVNHSYLPLMFSSIGLGLSIIHAVYFYWYQAPTAGKGLHEGLNPQTVVDNRVVWTDRVLMVVAVILYAIWFTIALTHFVRTDGKGESAVVYIVTDPAADANITGEILMANQRHHDLVIIGLFFSTLCFVFGSIAWGLYTQTMILWLQSGGNLRRSYGGTGDYALGDSHIPMSPLGSGTGRLAGPARV